MGFFGNGKKMMHYHEWPLGKFEYHEILSSGPRQTSSDKVMKWPIKFVHLGIVGELFHNSSIVVHP